MRLADELHVLLRHLRVQYRAGCSLFVQSGTFVNSSTPAALRRFWRVQPTVASSEPAIEEYSGGWDSELARCAGTRMPEARQSEALTVREHARHLRRFIVLVLALPGDEQRGNGEPLEVGESFCPHSGAKTASNASGSALRATACAQAGNSLSKA